MNSEVHLALFRFLFEKMNLFNSMCAMESFIFSILHENLSFLNCIMILTDLFMKTYLFIYKFYSIY